MIVMHPVVKTSDKMGPRLLVLPCSTPCKFLDPQALKMPILSFFLINFYWSVTVTVVSCALLFA